MAAVAQYRTPYDFDVALIVCISVVRNKLDSIEMFDTAHCVRIACKVLGLAISNGIVALSCSLLAQYKGSANINDGRGAIVIALAAIFIGLSVSLKIKPNFVVSLIGVVSGGVVYYIVYNFVILLGLKTDYLKMLSAIIVAVFLAVPYVKGEYFTKRKPLPIKEQAGGDGHA